MRTAFAGNISFGISGAERVKAKEEKRKESSGKEPSHGQPSVPQA
jgi:hypothetical protein